MAVSSTWESTCVIHPLGAYNILTKEPQNERDKSVEERMARLREVLTLSKRCHIPPKQAHFISMNTPLYTLSTLW